MRNVFFNCETVSGCDVAIVYRAGRPFARCKVCRGMEPLVEIDGVLWCESQVNRDPTDAAHATGGF